MFIYIYRERELYPQIFTYTDRHVSNYEYGIICGVLYGMGFMDQDFWVPPVPSTAMLSAGLQSQACHSEVRRRLRGMIHIFVYHDGVESSTVYDNLLVLSLRIVAVRFL